MFKEQLSETTPGLSTDTAEGFFAFENAVMAGAFPQAVLLKAQTEGPITLSHCLYSQGAPLAADQELFAGAVSFIARQAVWQVRRLQAAGLPVLFVFDEPALGLSLTEASPLDAGMIEDAIKTVVQTVRETGVLVGIHCCSALPLALFATLKLDFLSFDAYLVNEGYAWCKLVQSVTENSGALAFGLIPPGKTGESSGDCDDFFRQWFKLAAASGELNSLAGRTIVTATCGLGLATPRSATASFESCQAVATRIAQL